MIVQKLVSLIKENSFYIKNEYKIKIFKGFTCKNVPGSYKCIQKECDTGYVFNYNIGDCERIVCKIGFEMNSNGICTGNIINPFLI